MEVELIRRLLLILFMAAMVLILGGCQNGFGYINARWIDEISLEDTPAGRTGLNLLFTDRTSVGQFAAAMNKSKPIGGELDYDAEFSMRLTYGDGYTQDYDLSLGKAKGQPGLLVAGKHFSDGYTIPAARADKLRDLIYGSGAENSGDRTGEVTVAGPVTVSRNDLYALTGSPLFLDLELVSGTYSEDWSQASVLAGRSWSGNYRLAVLDDQGQRLSSYPLTGYPEPLRFGEMFALQFGDYNGDGDPDFTIGQYGSSNGSLFRLYTLRKDRSIAQLPVAGAADLFISTPDAYSTGLETFPGGFKTEYYDNSLGQDVESIYKWTGTVFERMDNGGN